MTLRKWIFPVALAIAALGTSARAQIVSGPVSILTPGVRAADYVPRISADGSLITYTGSAGKYTSPATYDDIYVMKPDGTGRTRLITPRQLGSEQWSSASPTGRYIAFHAFTGNADQSGAVRVWVYDMLTATSTQMTINGGSAATSGYDAYPVWSPDGTKIAFMSKRNSIAGAGSGAPPQFQDYQIFLMNAMDGAGNLTPETTTTNIPIQLTNFSGTTTTTLGIGNRQRFTADGNHLIFIATSYDRQYTPTSPPPAKPWPMYYDIFKCDLTDSNGDKMGDNMVRLTDATALKVPVTNAIPQMLNPCQGSVGGQIYFDAGIYPDNGKLHIYAIDDQDNTQGQAAIVVNKGLHPITSGNTQEDYPSATADKLVFRIQDPAQFFENRFGVENTEIGIVPLAAAPAPGTAQGSVAGVIVADGGQPIANEIVELWNGYNNLIASATTAADGAYSFSNLEPGAYMLKFQSTPAGATVTFDTRNSTYSTVTRGFNLLPNDHLTIDAFTSLGLSPRPVAPVATIVDPTAANPTVSLRWPLNGTQSVGGITFTPIGYNVYRAPAETGPWTKLNTTPVANTAPLEFVDTNPGDITHAFYAVTLAGLSKTAPAVDPTITINESARSEVAQATNNLLQNPSFENVDSATGLPVGWVTQGTSNVAKWGVDTTQGAGGTSSLYMEVQNPTTPAYGQVLLNEDLPYAVPNTLDQPMVQGVFCKLSAIKTNTASRTNLASVLGDPNPGAWLSYSTNFDTGSLTGSNTAVPGQTTVWTWLNQGNVYVFPYEFTTYTRYSVLTATEANQIATPGGRIYFDEAHFQAKRSLSVGTIYGRVVDSAGNGVAGVTVTSGSQTTYSKSNGVYVLANVPTGQATVTISYPGQPTRTVTLWNVGGAFIDDTKYSTTIPIAVGGTVTYADGTPADDAKVRIVMGNLITDGAEPTFETTTDAAGNYTFDFSSGTPDFTKKCWVAASKGGYQSAYVSNQSIALSGKTMFTLKLGAAVPVIEIARASTPPTIDGTVNAAEWQNSAAVPLAYKYSSGTTPDVSTKAYALWDDNNLYFAMVATEPNIPGLVAAWSGDDQNGSGASSIWADDNMGMFIDPTNSTAIGYYGSAWQLGVNANQTLVGYSDGTIRTGPTMNHLRNVENIAGLVVANHVDTTNGNWSIEFSIPCGPLGMGLNDSQGMSVTAPTAGSEWRAMFVRNRAQSGENSSTCMVPSTASYAFEQAFIWNTLRFVNSITPPVVKGDLTGDGLVTNADAFAAIRIAGGAEALAGRTQGDVAGSDGKVDLLDALRILRKVNGLEPAW